MKIYITIPHSSRYTGFLTPKAMDKLRELGEVERNPYERHLTMDEIIEFAQDADVIITGWSNSKFYKKDIERLPNLKMIAHAGGTVAPIVASDVYETSVKVISGNDVFAKSVAEGTLCYILAALRRLEQYMAVMREGGFRTDNFESSGLFGKKVGIIGFGAIARHFLNVIRWFDCEVLIYSSHLTDEEAATYGGRTAGLEEIFAECDIISIHASNTEKNRGIVTRELMESMKSDALLVNTARGPIIDEPAMIELLQAERFYAALDVYTEEPPAPDAPIRQCKNALLMPHMGGPTIDMRGVVTLELCKDIARLQKGEPLQYEISAAAAKRMTGAS